MGLLTGSLSVTRFNVLTRPMEPDLDAAAFREIPLATQVRERIGFLPFEPGAPYQVGQHRWAFRVRIDVRRPDATAVRERVGELVASEKAATGAPGVGAKRRKQLREQAEEELLTVTPPRSRVIECCLDGEVLYVGSTANAHLGRVLQLLAEQEIRVDFKAPWTDRGEADPGSELVEANGPGQSTLGCRFLKALLGDEEILVEPEVGSVRLQTHDARVTLGGGVLPDLLRYAESGAELLAAKLTTEDASFRLDALGFRIASLRLETERHDSWIEQLDERMEKMTAVWALLDRRYAQLAERLGGE